jgi:hypothetical protein
VFIFQQYSSPSILTDIVKGCNAGCQKTKDLGFCAQAGWDPVTGLGSICTDVIISLLNPEGTPDYEAMAAKI